MFGKEGNRIVHAVERESSLWKFLQECLAVYRERTRLMTVPPTGETSIGQKLEAIIETQEQLGIRFGLLETRAENIHGLLFDLVNSLTADPEKIQELAASVKAVREKLQTSVDNQKQQGD